MTGYRFVLPSFTVKAGIFLFVFSMLVLTTDVNAHHSFAIYDIDNKIERTGVLTRFDFVQPHIRLELEVTNEDGSLETWEIESMSTRRWDQADLDREFASVGDQVTIRGWPARNGKDEMVLSTIIGEQGAMVVRQEILQQRARDELPETTIKRD